MLQQFLQRPGSNCQTRGLRTLRALQRLFVAVVVFEFAVTTAWAEAVVRIATSRQPAAPESLPMQPPSRDESTEMPRPRLEIDIRPSEGMLPAQRAAQQLLALGTTDGDVGPRWYLSPYYWEAPGLFHRPLYFEDPALERHGRSRCVLLQPVISAARGAGQFVALPVQMVVHRPLDCVYTLGYGKPRVPPVYPYPWCAPLYHNPYANYPFAVLPAEDNEAAPADTTAPPKK